MRLKFLLRPGWIALILLGVVFSWVCFTLLAPWQFRRDTETETRNNAIAESFQSAPKPLNEVLPAGRAPDASTEWIKVTFRGHYLPNADVLGWQRTVLGEPAFEVLTPFQVDGGSTVLVDRGYIRPVQGVRAPPFAPAPSGDVTLSARVHVDESDSKHRPMFDHDGHRWVYAVNADTVARGTGVALSPGYFALSEQQPGGLEALPLPRLESGPYFSYALQWISFGVMSILAIGYLVYSELRPPETPTRDAPAQPGKRPRKMSVAEAIAEDERREREETS